MYLCVCVSVCLCAVCPAQAAREAEQRLRAEHDTEVTRLRTAHERALRDAADTAATHTADAKRALDQELQAAFKDQLSTAVLAAEARSRRMVEEASRGEVAALKESLQRQASLDQAQAVRDAVANAEARLRSQHTDALHAARMKESAARVEAEAKLRHELNAAHVQELQQAAAAADAAVVQAEQALQARLQQQFEKQKSDVRKALEEQHKQALAQRDAAVESGRYCGGAVGGGLCVCMCVWVCVCVCVLLC